MKFNLQQWEIQGLYTNKNLLDIPPFQRERELWSLDKRRLFIGTILLGWKVPKIYLNYTQDQKYEIIDGQQRLFTILQFVDNDLKIEINNDKIDFKSLDLTQQNQILSYKLDIEIISNASEDDISELFYRLQQGVALNAAEKINSITGMLSDFINTIEAHSFFNKTNFRKKRYGVKNLCQQLVSLENGTQGAKFPEVSDFFQKNRNFDDENKKNQIVNTLNYLDRVFVNPEEYLTKAGNVISIYWLCSWTLKNNLNLAPQKMFSFFTAFYSRFDSKENNPDISRFYLTLLQSTAGHQSIQTRDSIFKRYFYLEEPKLIGLLDEFEKIKFYSAMEDLFLQNVSQIQDIIKEINERAISGGKHITFDITSQSAYTFSAMSRRLKTQDECESFIDLMWKTFYEGSDSGNRINSFREDRIHVKQVQDVNILIKIDDLRKVNAHDLEHDRTTYEEKIRHASAINNLYTNKKLMRDFNEDDLVVFQYSLINELLQFLKEYNETLK